MQMWVVAGVAVAVLVLVVLVAAVRVRTLNRPQAPAPIAPGMVAGMPEDRLVEVQALLGSGKKIAAIKRLRELTGMGLAEAKNVVDAMEAGVPAHELKPRDPRPASSKDAAARVRALPAHTAEEARRLVGQRKLVHAIKVIRQGTGMGLREAKETAEAMAAEQFGAEPSAAQPSGAEPSRPAGPPAAGAPPAGAGDLATRVRELRADDRTGEAIELVAAETGMSLVDATRFVESVSS